MKQPRLSILTICGIEELDSHSARAVTHVLSILDPEWAEPQAFAAFDSHRRTTLRFHDAIEPGPGIILPETEDVRTILSFGRDVSGAGAHLLIHCHAGISRSTAAMAMILAEAFPQEDENELIDRLLGIRPQAWPNSRMIAMADELLRRDGRLTAAVARIYARRLAARPELADIMSGLGRAREVEIAANPGLATTWPAWPSILAREGRQALK